MAKLTQLDDIGTVTSDDLTYIVDSPLSSPVSKKVSLASIKRDLYQTELDSKRYFHGIVSRPVVNNPLPTTITSPIVTISSGTYNIQYFFEGTVINVVSDVIGVLDDETGLTTTSGTLLNSNRYVITNYIEGDDFSNIATTITGTPNTTGYTFTTTNTTPTNWTHSSSVKHLVSGSGTYYCYFNSTTGQILITKNFPGINITSNIIVAIFIWNGTNYGLVLDERHNYARNCSWHVWAHDTVGCRYGGGLDRSHTGTGITSTFSISSGEIHDEDIEFIINTTTHCRIFHQTSTGYIFDTTLSTCPFKYGANNRPVYADSSNSYTLTEISNNSNRFVNFFMYATSDLLCPIYIFVETTTAALIGTGYNSVTTARAIPFPNVSSVGPELKPIYRVIVSGTGVVQAVNALDDYRTVSSLPQSAGIASATAGSITFNPYDGITSSNVQSAIEEVNDTFIYEAARFFIDNYGSTITTDKYIDFQVRFNCTIIGWSLLNCHRVGANDQIVMELWKTDYASYDGGVTHPVVGDKISGSSPITLANPGDYKNQDVILTGWTKTLLVGDILRIKVTSVTDCMNLTLNINVMRT